jgi:hypothetical protein
MRILIILFVVFCVIFFSGCSLKKHGTNNQSEVVKKHKKVDFEEQILLIEKEEQNLTTYELTLRTSNILF